MHAPLYEFSHDLGPDNLEDVTPLPHGVPITHIPQPARLETLLAQSSAPSVAFEQWASEVLGGYEYVWTRYPDPDRPTRQCQRCRRFLGLHEFHENENCADDRLRRCRYCISDEKIGSRGTSRIWLPLEARHFVIDLRHAGYEYDEIIELLRSEFNLRVDKKKLTRLVRDARWALRNRGHVVAPLGRKRTNADGKVAA